MPHHPGELTGSWQTLLDDEAVCFISWATTALVVYEYCITFEMELQHIWGRKFTGTTVLFFLNRYLPFAIRLVDLLSMLPWPDSSLQSCIMKLWLSDILTCLNLVVIALIAAVRVYALWSCDLRFFLLVFAASTPLPAITLYIRYRSQVYIPTLTTFVCSSKADAMTGTLYSFLLLASRCAAIAADALVVLLSWWKTYRVWRLAAKANIGTGLAQLLLRDGTVYFVALVVFNGAAIICSQEMGGNALLDLVSTMSSILMSRFILNLREVYQSNLHEHIDIIQISTVQYSSMHFTSSTKCSVIGTMGAPVGDDDFLQDRKLDDEWEGDPEQAPPLFSEDPLMSGLRDDAWVQLDDRWSSRGSCYQPQV